jgi:hypothetical protein
MEPHREEWQKAPPPSAEQKPKRFRVVKLEERIAPSGKGVTGNPNHGSCVCFTNAGDNCGTTGTAFCLATW